MKPQRTLGFFGGTFDPIHFGHLSLALGLQETHRLDGVVFCPAACSPFKKDHPPRVSGKDRLEMTRLAIEEIPFFSLSSIEIDRAGISYTVDTLRSLRSDEIQWRLLLSHEVAQGLQGWKDVEELLQLAPPCIGTRSQDKPLPSFLQPYETPLPLLEISSTLVRTRLAQRLCCAHLVPSPVLRYIQEKNLYQEGWFE